MTFVLKGTHMPRKVQLFVILIVIALCLAAAGLPPAVGKTEPASQDANPASGLSASELRGFHLVSPEEGWLLLGEELYWTQDAGGAWEKITPLESSPASIQAVAFLDAQSGWVVLSAAGSDGFPVYQLAQTTDRGATWQTFPISLFDPGDVRALAQAVYLDFIDPTTGWLAVKQAAGSSFSLGTLFKTADGGHTWTRLESPTGGPLVFISAEVGWMAGGAAGDEFYRTQDGGLTWSSQALPETPDVKHRYLLPAFNNPEEGLLPVATSASSGAQIDFYATDDGGQTWQFSTSAPLDEPLAPGVNPALSILDGRDWVMLAPGRQEVLHSENGLQTTLAAPGALPGAITGLDMVTHAAGWASFAVGDCQPGPACSLAAGLLRTADGGQTWQLLTLPQPVDNPSQMDNPQFITGQGWDTCDIPSPSQMQAWMDHSPYRIWNLYIGGSSLADCGTLTAAYISQLAGQGWKFIPTWVGPQAPCWGINSRMSYDPATAYNQGTDEANAAIARAASLLLTHPDQTGAIIYYDLEAYDISNAPCRNAVKSFMEGWTARLQDLGNQAAVYGSGCYSALSDFATNPHIPDAIWAAQWIWPYRYRSDATVWDISCLSNSLWSSHQRLHQYAGAHDETWGGVTINVDSNVADGIVLDLSAGPKIHFTSPVDNAWLPTDQVLATVVPVDPYAAISRVEFQWWQGANWEYLGADTDGSNGWSILFDTHSRPELQGGALYAFAYDSVGNRSGAGAWNLGIDHTPPTVSMSTRAMYGGAHFRDFHVLWSGADNLSGVASYDIQYHDSTNNNWLDLVTNTTDSEYTFVGLDGQTYSFRGRARDVSGNLGAYSTDDVHFTVQTCPVAEDAYEPDNTPTAAGGIIPYDPPQVHNFDTEGDADWLKFDAVAHTPYILQTSNTGGYADTVLSLYAPDAQTLLAFNDDYPGLNWASRIDWVAPSAGTYYLKVVHWDPYGAGCETGYTVSIIKAYLLMLPVINR